MGAADQHLFTQDPGQAHRLLRLCKMDAKVCRIYPGVIDL
jgi:hypothetical protein